MNQADRHEAAELARLRKQLASPASTDFEREDADRRIKRIVDGPTCAHCLKPVSTHGKALCPVVLTFQRRHGKTFPTETQAAEIRQKLAENEAAKRKAEAKRKAKASQGSLF